MFRRILTVGLVTGLVLMAVPVGTAGAVQVPTPLLTITGEPTAAETNEIQAQWERLLAGFPSARTCLTQIGRAHV